MKTTARNEWTCGKRLWSLWLTDILMTKRLFLKRAALFVFLLALACGGCGSNARRKAEAASRKGWEALKARDGTTAREYFRLALAEHDAHPEANHGMARTLTQFYFDNREALRYFRRYIDAAPQDAARQGAPEQATILQDMIAETLEDPCNAAAEMLAAARAGDRESFFERLSPYFLLVSATESKDHNRLLAELGAFSLGGRPEIAYRDISRNAQAATLVVRIRPSALIAGSNFQFIFIRGRGDMRNLWQLAAIKPLDA